MVSKNNSQALFAKTMPVPRTFILTSLLTTGTILGGMLSSAPAQAAAFNVTSLTVAPLIDGTNSAINTITYLNQSLPITALRTNNQTWNVGGLPTTLTLRRSGVGGAVAGRQVVWGERPTSSPVTTVRIPVPTTTEAALSQNNLFSGTDNLFVNTGNTANNQSDVERADFIIKNGTFVTATRAVAVLERGTSTSHDGFEIAAITALDSQGNPSAYGSLNNITSGWGTTALRTNTQVPQPNPNPNPTYTVLNKSSSSSAFTNTADVTGQNIGGILISLDQLAPVGTKIYGYSLFAVDTNNQGNPNNLVNWQNSTFFPTNTQEGVTQGGGGIDLSALNVGIARETNDRPDLEYVGRTNPFDEPSDPLFSPKIFEVEGRVGATGRRDYEFALGLEGANQTNTGQIYRDWLNNTNVPWQLAWNQTLGQASFTIGSQVISYPLTTPGPSAGLPFNRFGLILNAKTDTGVVDPNTTITLGITSINGLPINPVGSPPNNCATPNSILVSATSPAAGGSSVECYFASSDPIATMMGIARIGWTGTDPTLRGRSRVTFKIKGYDPPIVAPSNTITVPEPNTGLSLLAMFFLGSGLALKHKKKLVK